MLITNFGQSIHSPSDLIRDGYEYNKFCYVIIYKVIVINKKTKKGPKLKKVNISSETRCHNSDLRLTKEVFWDYTDYRYVYPQDKLMLVYFTSARMKKNVKSLSQNFKWVSFSRRRSSSAIVASLLRINRQRAKANSTRTFCCWLFCWVPAFLLLWK